MKNSQKIWLYRGIISGFLLGFLYFAIGVYQHSHHSKHIDAQKTTHCEHDVGSTQ